jgi:Ca2+-binding EF-hand superfamily protein
MKKKLEFSFDLFDTNDNGDLTSDELHHGLIAMLKLLVFN